jgi:hypothetical protein
VAAAALEEGSGTVPDDASSAPDDDDDVDSTTQSTSQKGESRVLWRMRRLAKSSSSVFAKSFFAAFFESGEVLVPHGMKGSRTL